MSLEYVITDDGGLEAWVTAVGRPDITFDVSEEVKVCSRHFVTGKPALGMVQMDLDWVPTLHLNNEAEIVPSPDKKKPPMKKGKNIVNTPVKRKWKEAVKDTAEPIPLQWKELKSCLQVLMTDKNDPKEVTPAVDNSALSFEEYFRNALTASLDSCQTSQQKRPSCGNCVRLEGRISELEERLATPHQILGQNIWPQWTEPLSQSTGEPSSPCKEDKKIPPQTNTFMVNLIKRHWFLRFSPSSNTIWCHVCRLYAGKGCRNSKFVTGTRSFQNSAIALHTRNRNHKECVKKFMALKNAKKTVGRFRR
uniref:THAP-type domain-containing protein n=1 Tax=Knipowitschia caucasica TaxID=637954 RepID=A0AAV2KVU1_KNICA